MAVAFPSTRSVWQRIPPAVWLLLAVGAAWYSLLDLSSLALSESPLAFVTLVPVISGWLLIHDGRRTRALRSFPDRYLLLLELTIAACLFLTALWVVVLLPTRLSWLYWLYRFDLLAVPLVVAGMILVLWGLTGLGALSRGV